MKATAAVIACAAILWLCICAANCKVTPAYNKQLFRESSNMECGEKVQVVSGQSYMNCWRGPSRLAYTGGGGILKKESMARTSLWQIDGPANKSRGIGFGYDFVVKDAGGSGNAINLGALFYAANQFYVRLDVKEHFVDIHEEGWERENNRIDISQDGSLVVVTSPRYSSQSGIAKHYALEGSSYAFVENIFPSTNQTNSFFGAQVAMSADGSIIAISAPKASVNGTYQAGKVYVFRRQVSTSRYTQLHLLTLSNLTFANDDQFGYRIVLAPSGLKLIVCSPFISFYSVSSRDGDCSVYIFNQSSLSYSSAQLYMGRRYRNRRHGGSVAISANEEVIVVGRAREESPFYIFTLGNESSPYIRRRTYWGELRADVSIALSENGSVLVAGSPKGSARSLRRSGGAVETRINLERNGALSERLSYPNTEYINSIISDSLSIVPDADMGFFFQPSSFSRGIPSRHFFSGDDAVWKSYSVNLPRRMESDSVFGYAFHYATSSKLLASSELPGNGRDPELEDGRVHIFAFNETLSEYVEKHTIKLRNANRNSHFGSSLAFHPGGQFLFIGCEKMKGANLSEGAVYIYSITPTGSSLVSILKSPKPGLHGYYGSSLFSTSSYLGVGARNESSSGSLHLYAVNDDLSNITLLQTLFLNDSSSPDSAFGATIAITPDVSKIVVGAPGYDSNGLSDTGAIVIYSHDGDQFVQYDLIAPVDMQAGDRVGDYVSISSDGNQILIGSPDHDVNGEVNAGQVYHYVSLGSSRLNGSTHYELEEVLFSPDGVIAGSRYGLGVSIHPTVNITLIGCALSNQEDIDRPTVFIYEEDALIVSATSSTSGDDSSDKGAPLSSVLGGLGGGLAGLIFLLLVCYCFCCMMILLSVVFVIIVLVVLVAFLMMVGLGGSLGGTGTVIGFVRGGDEGICYEMDIINEGMPEYKELQCKEIKLVKQIGEGSFGVVFLGEWRGIDVAVKRIHANQLDEKRLEEFHHEAKVMGKMGNHPNVCGFIGAITEGDMMLVTRFYHNGSLEDYLIKNNLPADSPTLLKMARDAACGLLHLHEEGIIHRDIATRNMLVSSNLTVVVTDFGLSRQFEDDDVESQQTQTSIGPIRWMAPEMLRSHTYSKSSDCWMYGCMLYEMWAKKKPFEGETMCEIIFKVREQEGHVRVPSKAPPSVKRVMEGVFQQDPSSRLTMSEIYDIFTQALEEQQ